MAYGEWEGRRVDHAEVRSMFTRESLLTSDWYKDRLCAKQEHDVALWSRHIAALEAFEANGVRQLDVSSRLAEARRQLVRVSSVSYLAELVGTIGSDPSIARLSGHSYGSIA
jgi:hypothetical protein